MSLLPRITEKARELVSREFDTRGPDVCTAEVIEHLEQHNPELLDMAARCAADLDNPGKAMLGFGVFYRLLVGSLPQPRVFAIFAFASLPTVPMTVAPNEFAH